jgi:7-cyano-7-deazaguanine synthase
MNASSSDAVVLLSGGIDSSTALAVALADGVRCHALTFHYGQRHCQEVTAAARVAQSLGVADHRIVHTELGSFGGSALTDKTRAVPTGRQFDQMRTDIPPTYVPARNTVFLAYALALAEVTNSDLIYVGVNAIDYSGYPDCRPEYIEAFQRLACLATRRGVEGKPPRIVAPFLRMRKADIIRTGLKLGLDYSLTLSCYDPDEAGRACGQCDSCRLRRKGFAEAAAADPTVYKPGASADI